MMCEWQDEHSKVEARLERAEGLLRELYMLHWEQSVQPPGGSELDEKIDAFLRGD